MGRMILGNFRSNRCNKPKLKIGDTFTSRSHGDYEIVAYASKTGITIQFANTGNKYFVTTQQIKINSVKDEKLCN